MPEAGTTSYNLNQQKKYWFIITFLILLFLAQLPNVAYAKKASIHHKKNTLTVSHKRKKHKNKKTNQKEDVAHTIKHSKKKGHNKQALHNKNTHQNHIVHHRKLVSYLPNNHSLARINTIHLAKNTHIINKDVTKAQKHLVDFVDKTVYNLRYTSYRLGGSHFDASHGVYILDCSIFVDNVLSKIYPKAWLDLVNASGANRPASQHYYDFFKDLSDGSTDRYWDPVEKVGQLLPGDILVFRDKKPHPGKAAGHVMVVMSKPIRTAQAFFIRVADAAPIRHSADTRQRNESGIGIGTMLLKPNPHTGKPAAYAWALGGSWRKNVNFAMARPLKLDV